MALLSIANLGFAYGEQSILDGVNLTLNSGEHVGLVGRNGTGKSTLMKLIIGSHAIKPSAGQIQLARGARVGYLSQDLDLAANLTLREEACRAFAELTKLHEKLDTLTHAMAEAAGDALDRLLKEYDTVERRMEAAGGYAVDHQIDATLHGVGLSDELFRVKVGDLSGGQQGRLALAKLLLSQPDILLLDEPTNHLDITARTWLEEYLIGYRGAVMLISHDRWLLDRAVTKIYELESGQLVEYPGHYEKYRSLRIERHHAQQRAFDRQQTKVRHEQEFIDRYRAGQRARQAQGRQKRLDRYKQSELIDRPIELDAMNLRFAVARRAGDLVIVADSISKGYEGKPLFRTMSINIKRGHRLGIIGPNGSGKSTLVRCLLGETECDDGQARLGAQVNVGHYRQTHEQLDLTQTVAEYLCRRVAGGFEQSARDLAGAFLFSGIQQDQPLSDLSGGERSRAVLAGLVAGGHNLLVLDEPTNHLDIPSAERLEEALHRYGAPPTGRGENTTGGGTLVIVTHDRMLLDNLVDQLLIFDGHGTVRHFFGTYSEFLQAERTTSLTAATRPPKAAKRSLATAKRKKSENRRNMEENPKQRFSNLATGTIEAKIIELEQQVADIDGQLGTEDVYRDAARVRKLVSERDELTETLDPLEREWLRRSEKSG